MHAFSRAWYTFLVHLPGHTPQHDDSGREDSLAPEDGEVKGSTSGQVRKAQNRIAQREFRLRKQQYIRDLEAKVEVLSGDKEERIELMTLLVRTLLKENKDLRGMVKTMAAFVGEGLGSCLPRLGLSANQLDAILNRADTDTAYEAFVNLKASREMEASNPGIIIGEPRRRPSESPANSKRKRDTQGETHADPKGKRPAGLGTTSGGTIGGGSASSSAEKIRQTGSKSADGTPRDGLSKAMSVPASPPPGSYDYLFPDLDTLWSGAQSSYGFSPVLSSLNQAALAGSQGSRSGPGVGSSTGTSYRNDFAQHLMSGISTPTANSGMSSIPATGADLSGFGLTIPPAGASSLNSTSTGGADSAADVPIPPAMAPMDSLAGPRPNLGAYNTAGTYASHHQPVMPTDPTISKLENGRQLQDEVSHLTYDNSMDGPGMNAAEIAERRRQQDRLIKTIEAADPADRKMETMQLITYHLNNFRMNHEYHLPPSLRPTAVQRTVPHEHAIDGIIFPSIRDRMILLRGQYDLVEVFHSMLREFVLHGDDVLDHNNYEVTERFISDYNILVDEVVVTIANKWRAQRGAPPIAKPIKGVREITQMGQRIGISAQQARGNQPRTS
ncbi:hypothetical protein IAU60_000907 [Kwoniella sp. DSM 27419]